MSQFSWFRSSRGQGRPWTQSLRTSLWASIAVAIALIPVLMTVAWPSFNPGLLSVFLHLAALLLLPTAFGVRIVRWLKACWFFVLLAPVAAFCYLTTRQQPSEWFFLVMAETNSREASVFVPQIIGFLGMLTLLVLAYRWSLARISSEAVLPKAARGIVFLLAFGLPLGKIATSGLASGWKDESWRVMENYPVGTLAAGVRAVELSYQIGHRGDAGKAVTLNGSAPVLPVGTREIHLLVIGETARAASFQIDGYDRETTPRLKATEGLVNFTDVIAPAPVTMISVPVLLTPTTALTAKDASITPSVMHVFRKAGYKTYWLSTQLKHGFWDTRCSTFANDADEAQFLSGKLATTGEPRDAAKDMELVIALREILARNEPRVMIVLHTMGSHAIYSDRYPAEFNKFPADPAECAKARNQLLTSTISEEQASHLRNSYDNSIRYTDHVLHELIGTLRSEHAVSSLYYVSDHGENSGDAPVMPFGHGTLTTEVLHVPMMMWLSPEYRALRKDKVAALDSHAGSPISSDTTFHTMIDVAGLSCNVSDQTRSAASKSFAVGKRMVTALDGTLADYDAQVLPGEQRKGWRPLHMAKSEGAPLVMSH